MRLSFPIELRSSKAPLRRSQRSADQDAVFVAREFTAPVVMNRESLSQTPAWCSAPEFCDFINRSDSFPFPPSAA